MDFKKTQLPKNIRRQPCDRSVHQILKILQFIISQQNMDRQSVANPLAEKYRPVKALSVPINGTSGKIFDRFSGSGANRVSNEGMCLNRYPRIMRSSVREQRQSASLPDWFPWDPRNCALRSMCTASIPCRPTQLRGRLMLSDQIL